MTLNDAPKLLVEIEWTDPAHDWPYYWLLSCGQDDLWLKGADFPDGSVKHQGDVFCVPRRDVKRMTLA